MKKQLLCLALVVSWVALPTENCPAQLFGGGGLLGGGGGGGLLGGGGGRPLLGGGGFGGGRPLLGGGGFGGGAPILRGPMINRPIARPALPNLSRPAIGRPGIGGGPGIGNLPSRPARPILGGGIGGRPGIINRPAIAKLPGAPSGPLGGGLPAIANRPAMGQPGLPGVVRPSQPVTRDRLNQFLNGPPNANRPVAGQLPKPSIGDDRPILGGGNRPLLPIGDRPLLGNRPIVDRPIMPNLGEKILRDEIRTEIIGRRVERAVRVRERVRDLYHQENHPVAYWWHHMWTKHPVWSWWRVTAPYRWANWTSVTGWCGYSSSYAQPVSYEYTDEGVYANGQQVTVDDGYSEQARELARAGADLLKQKVAAQEADKLEWLPLGVFSLSDKKAGDPTMFLQLTISKEGIVAGTFFNASTSENLSLQGGADRESTRLAVTIGDKDDVVIETGLYNITEEQSSALVHHQDGTRENWLLVKMPDPQGKQDK